MNPPDLPWPLLEECFPFAFAWDTTGNIVKAGASALRLYPRLAQSCPLQDAFELKRPEGKLTAKWLGENQGKLLLLELRANGVLMRGQVLQLKSCDLGVFVGTPWLNSPDDLERLGLCLTDFAPHDSAQDLLQMVQVQRSVNQELKEITARLKVQRRLLGEKEAEARKLAMVAERTDNAVILADKEGLIEWVNIAFERITGWTLEEVRGKKPGSFLQGPRTDAIVAREMGQRLREGRGFHSEILNYRKDGTSYWVSIEVQPIEDAEGKITHFMALEADVSNTKRNELRRQLENASATVIASGHSMNELVLEMLRALGGSLQAVFGAWWEPVSEDGTLRLSRFCCEDEATYGRFIEASSGLVLKSDIGLPGRVWASGTSHWITDVQQDANFPRREAAVACDLDAAVALPILVDGTVCGVLEFYSRHLDEPDPHLLETLNHIGGELGVQIKRLQAEAALRRSERAMNEGQRLAHLGTWEWDMDADTLNWSDEKFRIYGFEPQSFNPTMDHVRRSVLAEDLPRLLTALEKAAQTGVSQEVSYRINRPDGSIRHVHTLATAENNAEGRPCRIVGTMQDVTELMQTQDAYKQAQRISHLGNWTLDLGSGKIRWSDEKFRIYGYEPGAVEVDMEFCRRSIHPEDIDAVMQYIDSVAKTGKTMAMTYRIFRPDGEVRHLRSSAEVSLDASGKAREVLGTALDITELVQVQRTLQQTEERWHLALQNNGLGVWDWNIISGYVLYTDRLQQMLGYEAGEWPQHVDSWASRVHPDDLPSVMDKMDKCLSGETPDYICEHRLHCKDGSWKWVHDVGRIIDFTKDGRPQRMIGTQMDINIRKQSEEATKRRAELLNGIRAAQEHFISATNMAQVFAEMLDVVVRHTHSTFGFIAEVLKDEQGAPYLRSYSITDIAWNDEIRKDIETMSPNGLEFRNLKTLFGAALLSRELVIVNDAANDPRSGGLPPGHPAIHTFLGLPVYNGLDMVGLIGLANRPDGYDKDELRELDPFLAAVNNMIVARREAERRSQIEEELRAARDRAEAASRAKSDFLTMISHEIRTPMNGVIGMARLLCTSGLEERQTEMAEAVVQSGTALVGIMDDILDFAKIEAGQIVLREEPLALAEVLEGVADLLAHEAAEKGISICAILTPGLPSKVIGDAGRLRQVLLNLAGNAVKFTDKGSVTLRACLSGQDLKFTVEDTGIGISEKHIERLFKPFTQLDSSPTRRFGGTGMGLAICKKLIERMNGTIHVESRPGEGSCFTLLVPAKVFAPVVVTPPDVPRLRIWIAEGAANIREGICASLQIGGHILQQMEHASQLSNNLCSTRADADVLVVNASWLDVEMRESVGRWLSQPVTPPRRLIITTTVHDEVWLPQEWDAVVLRQPLRRQHLLDALNSKQQRGQIKETTQASESDLGGALGLRVLVAEDNRVNARLVGLILERLGCEYDTVPNGQAAVHAFQRDAYDVVLMDCQMPIMDGIEAARCIREFESHDGGHRRRSFIIAMTANAAPEERQRSLKSGMDAHLSKPFDGAALSQMLAGLAHQPRTVPIEQNLLANWSVLSGQLGQNEAVQLASIWLEETPERVERLQLAFRSGRHDSVKREAHALRGSCYIFGMSSVVEACQTLEATSNDQKPPSDLNLAVLLREISIVAAWLRQQIKL
jgi:PAS domain S-box-containing protein